MKVLQLLIGLPLLALLAAPGQAQTVSIVTTPSGSYTNSAAAAMAKVISEKTRIRAIIQAQSQQGMIPVEAGLAEFGIGNAFDLTFYATGTGDYEGQAARKNVRVVAS